MQEAMKLGADALKRYGIQPAELRFHEHSENITLFVRSDKPVALPSGRGEIDRFALRLQRPGSRTREQIQAELDWVAALCRDTPVRAPEPIPTSSGERIALLPMPDDEDRLCVLSEWLEGDVCDPPSPSQMRSMGESAALLHAHGEAYLRENDVNRDPEDWADDGDGWPTEWLQSRWSDGIYEWQDANLDTVQRAIRIVARRVASYPRDDGYGMVHCDMHPYNCLFDGDRIALIDFDDCAPSFHPNDIAISFWYLPDDGVGERRDAYFAGYESVKPISALVHEQIDTFLVARQISMMGWALSWPTSTHMFDGPKYIAASLTRLRAFIEESSNA